jgi:hypothetical protein
MSPKLELLDLSNIPVDIYDDSVTLLESMLEFFDPQLYIKDKMLMQLIVDNIDRIIKYIYKNFPENKKNLNSKTLILHNLVSNKNAWNYFCDKIIFTNLKKLFPDSLEIFITDRNPKEAWDMMKTVPNLMNEVANESVKLGLVKSVTYFFNVIPIIVFDDNLFDPDKQGASSYNGIEVYAFKDSNYNIFKGDSYHDTIRHELTHQMLEFKCTITDPIIETYINTDREKYLELKNIVYLQSLFSELNAYFFEDPKSTLIFERDDHKMDLSFFGLNEQKFPTSKLTDEEYNHIRVVFKSKVNILNQFIQTSINNTIPSNSIEEEVKRRVNILFKLLFEIKNFEQLPSTLEGYNIFI